ncbi:MAG: two-component regulator propeller domain-containing protein, partial [Marinilabiliaceae bacterium]|nr:two-component regulator propeller domain-containing protein [Marinilabiliaceae bacterium]
MKVPGKTIILRCLFLLLPLSNCINGQDLKFIHYTNNDGLPYSAITDFVQDNHGLMWVGMRNSLCRFDGYEFREYFPSDSAGYRVPLRIPRLLKDSYGSLFVTTSDSRLFGYDDKLDNFYELNLPPGIKGYSSVKVARSGGFWVLKEGKIYHYIPGDLFCTALEDIYSFVSPELDGEQVARLVESDEFLYLLLHGGSILRINSEFKISEEFKYSDSVNDLAAEGLFLADDFGNLWLADDREGLFRVSINNKEVELFSSASEGSKRILHNMVRSITYDRLNRLWIGTENGLNIWDPAEKTMKACRYDYTNPDGLNSNAIYRLFTDSNGNVWVGTYFGGINIWYSGEEFFSIIEHGLTDYNLSGKQVSCITEDTSGNIWVGLEGNGFNIIDAESGKITKYEHDPSRNSLSYNNVHAILHGPDSRAYIGTYTGGLNIFDPSDKTFSTLSGISAGPVSGNIYSLLQAGDSILIGTEDGILVLNTSSRNVSEFFPEVFSGEIVESLCMVDNEVWISVRHSAFVWNIITNSLEEIKLYAPGASISFISSDSKQNLWFGDSYSGLHRYNREDSSFDSYNYANG